MRRAAAALATAGLAFLATPPVGWWPLAFVAFVPLLLAIRGATPGRAFALGWLAGTVWNLASCSWWLPVLERATELPLPVCLLLTLLIAAWQGLAYALGTWAVSLLAVRFELSPLFTAPLAFALAETAIPYLLKGYIAMTVWQVWPLVQFAELGGPPAVSAVVVLANAVWAGAAVAVQQRRMPDFAVWVGAVVMVAAVAAGWLRGAQVAAARSQAPVARIGMVQINPPAGAHARQQEQKALLQALGRATTVLLANGAELVVWPETVWPAPLARDLQGSPGPELLRTLVAGFDGRLLFGAVTAGDDGTRHNSAVLLSPAGKVEGYYHKNRPVPFFEYLPLGERIPRLSEAVRRIFRPDRPFLRPGTETTVLSAGPLRLGVLICSEEMQPGQGQAVARAQPNLLVGMASDFWFRETGAATQHLVLAAFRAVESRRDLLHVTDSGVSALVDATGRVRLMAEPAAAGSEPVTALQAEAARLDLASPGPSTIHLFPPACLLALALAVAGRLRWPLRAILLSERTA